MHSALLPEDQNIQIFSDCITQSYLPSNNVRDNLQVILKAVFQYRWALWIVQSLNQVKRNFQALTETSARQNYNRHYAMICYQQYIIHAQRRVRLGESNLVVVYFALHNSFTLLEHCTFKLPNVFHLNGLKEDFSKISTQSWQCTFSVKSLAHWQRSREWKHQCPSRQSHQNTLLGYYTRTD